MSAPPVVTLEGVSVTRDGRVVLEDIRFDVAAAPSLGVWDRTARAKDHAVRAILGLVPLSAGRIEVLGRPAASERRHTIGYVPQRHAFPPGLPGARARRVRLGRPASGEDVHASAARRGAIARVGIAELAARPVGRLSGGEQRAFTLAKALCASSKRAILDEPTSASTSPPSRSSTRCCGASRTSSASP